MPAGLIICVRCRKPRRTSPCDACRRASRPDMIDPGEMVRRQQAIDRHVQTKGLACPGWAERRPHLVASRSELTADHEEPVAGGGDPRGALVVRCRPCNSAKGARRE